MHNRNVFKYILRPSWKHGIVDNTYAIKIVIYWFNVVEWSTKSTFISNALDAISGYFYAHRTDVLMLCIVYFVVYTRWGSYLMGILLSGVLNYNLAVIIFLLLRNVRHSTMQKIIAKSSLIYQRFGHLVRWFEYCIMHSPFFENHSRIWMIFEYRELCNLNVFFITFKYFICFVWKFEFCIRNLNFIVRILSI